MIFYIGGGCGLQLHLDQILNSYWEILSILSGYALSTPHYDQYFIHSLACILVGSCPVVESYWKAQWNDAKSLGHTFLLLFPHAKNISTCPNILL